MRTFKTESKVWLIIYTDIQASGGVYVKEVVELVTVREEPAQEIMKAKSIAVSPEVIIPKEIVLNDLNFEHNAYILTSENIVELDPLMEMMKKDSSIRIKIIGHTSFIGEADYNKSLSLKRAESVRKYLVKKGITLQRMDAAGKGETEPIRFGHDDASLRMNRRVVIEIISTD